MPSHDYIPREEADRRLTDLRAEMKRDYVSMDRYQPIEWVIKSLVGLLILGVGTAIMKWILSGGLERGAL